MKIEGTVYTAKDFCSRFKISVATLGRWQRRGIVKPIKLGGRVYYTDDCFVDTQEKDKNE